MYFHYIIFNFGINKSKIIAGYRQVCYNKFRRKKQSRTQCVKCHVNGELSHERKARLAVWGPHPAAVL